ncbi:hypothetical protein [Natronorubrum daqingense]|uniref:Uncharacterized protein n=1 Tax=Natronorubrum daqingense TaxID=588898 RepID=A0A1N7F892_9EURY|nr:hypothetical protein [Natronorubrum daqingense]APX97598.1 hypothetical protein BB347_13820 [Natronorubrum daqingense]SIR96472.1 hypothetical protein SAMN05421809_3086 [Natronorubrum daqingense]
MSTLARALESSPLRTKKPRGRSGKLLVGTALVVLTLGMFTGTLDRRLEALGTSITVLEACLVLVGAAVAVAFVRYLLGKLKRAAGYGLLGTFGFGIGLPALVALPAVGGVFRRVGSTVYGAMPWIEPSRWGRLLSVVGGPRGLASGCYGTTLLAAGAWTDSLDDSHVVFGYELTLFSVFAIMTVPGIVVYYVRR